MLARSPSAAVELRVVGVGAEVALVDRGDRLGDGGEVGRARFGSSVAAPAAVAGGCGVPVFEKKSKRSPPRDTSSTRASSCAAELASALRPIQTPEKNAANRQTSRTTSAASTCRLVSSIW